jgi:hypothetical protein
MKHPIFTLFLLISVQFAFAQSTTLRVYQIFQNKCVQCHSNTDPEAGLDLEGSGTSEHSKALQVRSNLYNVTPANAAAAAKGHKHIYPGRVDQSFLFRKINQGLEPTLGLDGNENQSMPPYGQAILTDVEKELIRQWILFGAPPNGKVVEEEMLEEYYAGTALPSFPDGPPEAPTEEEGFQIKMGPFYLSPLEEVEYFQKYELDLPADVDVDRVDIQFGTYSHHFILYDFNEGGATSIPHGLRLEADHSNIGLVAAVQEPTDLRLPQGTAFIWDNQLVLDLNAHYINYSATLNYQAEVYVNIYTKPAGTAAQEMHTELLVNGNIPIPNNGNLITHTQHVAYNIGEIYLWGMMGHTHQYGQSYKVYKRLPGGQQGELLYDASCSRGIPGCIAPFFDYQHIPMRYFEPLQPLNMSSPYGIIHEASWINDGPAPVNFGPTSDDEMMVMIIMYTEDITGVVNTEEVPLNIQESHAYPNPANGITTFTFPENIGDIRIELMSANGQSALNLVGKGEKVDVNISELPKGIYFYQAVQENGHRYTGKLVKG